MKPWLTAAACLLAAQEGTTSVQPEVSTTDLKGESNEEEVIAHARRNRPGRLVRGYGSGASQQRSRKLARYCLLLGRAQDLRGARRICSSCAREMRRPGSWPAACSRRGECPKWGLRVSPHLGGRPEMGEKNAEHDLRDLNEEVRRIWNANAEWWDDRIGDGNAFQCELIEPATERLLGNISGCTVLDIACGAGRFGRRMAELGASVVAFDFSERFIERAKSRTPAELWNIEYHVIDATDEQQLLGLGTDRFDGAVATMALMDMTSIDPLMSALPELLKPEGWFVFSIMHPCFVGPDFCKFAEWAESDGYAAIRAGVKVTKYLTPVAWKGEGIAGELGGGE